MTIEEKNSIGEKISHLRKEQNYTQEQLAEILSVSRQAVSKWESNLSFPETEKLVDMSKVFHCSIDYLLKDDVDESGREVKVKILEVDSSELNRAYIVGILLTYLSFPPLFGFIVGCFSVCHANKYQFTNMKRISIGGMIFSLAITILMLVGIIYQL